MPATVRHYHNPQGDPCHLCGLPPARHIVQHTPDGDPCRRCGLDVAKHRKVRSGASHQYWAGIDGEGQGKSSPNTRHRYVMLAWSNESRSQRGVLEAPPNGHLSTTDCLDFTLAIPHNARLFAYAFNYDLTKILADVDERSLYLLFRPEKRQFTQRQRETGRQYRGVRPVKWTAPNGTRYTLNLLGTKFSVKSGTRRQVIWDVFKFYQSRFTEALKLWKVGDPDVVKRMEEMKEKRAEFDKLTRAEILDYCYDECGYMATLARRLTEAHKAVGLKLRAYYGAGSSASAMMKPMGIDKHKRGTPEPMVNPVASAFFGGRFENRYLGPVVGLPDPETGRPGPVYGYDISSAYPYQITFLPCLECGTWRLTRDRKDIDTARAALVRYELGEAPDIPWGPFPFRTKKGSIIFPSTSGGGWLWGEEYKQGERLFSHVRFVEAWVYDCDCDHRPFAKIPSYYRERLRIGKEGPGIVLKLAMNSIYGKLAQSIGQSRPFQCWIWAGMITSGTRAQILELLGLHRERGNMLMVATDGVYSRERLPCPAPRDTDTAGIYGSEQDKAKPLGGWEPTVLETGVFLVKPGIYFPLNPSAKELKKIRGRGVGSRVMLENWQATVDAYREGKSGITLQNVGRFNGARSSITRLPIKGQGMEGQYRYFRIVDKRRRLGDNPNYGEWQDKEVKLTFDPRPKREEIAADGSLGVRAFPGLFSQPYKPTTLAQEIYKLQHSKPGEVDVETIRAKKLYQEQLEQPDGGDYTDYETS